MTISSAPEPKRPYDARSRQRRAEVERQESRKRILRAARDCFLDAGYSQTKMTDIADAAGVAVATVYRAAPSKADLVLMLIEQAVTGHDSIGGPDEPMTFTDGALPQYPQIATETDPRVQVQIIAEQVTDILERITPLWMVFSDAAAVDDKAAAAMEATMKRRAAAFDVAVGLVPPNRLREEPDASTDTLWGLTSPELYHLLTTVRGWSPQRYRSWLRRTLDVLLLKPPDE